MYYIVDKRTCFQKNIYECDDGRYSRIGNGPVKFKFDFRLKTVYYFAAASEQNQIFTISKQRKPAINIMHGSR